MQKENSCDLTFLRYNQAFVGFLKKLWSCDCADFEIKMLIGKILADEALVVTFYIKDFGNFCYFVFDFLEGNFYVFSIWFW